MKDMRFFWPIFFLVFIFGSIGIWVTAPKWGSEVADLFGVKKTEDVQTVRPMSEHVGDGSGVADVSGKRPVAVPASAASASAKAAVRPAQEDDDLLPAMVGVQPVRPREMPGWGVTMRVTPCYTLEGVRAELLPGGVLFDCLKTHGSSNGEMVECRTVAADGTPEARVVLIHRREALFLTASRDTLSKARIQALQQYYALNAKIHERKRDLLQRRAEENPHLNAARIAYEAYERNQNAARRLAKEREAAHEGRRMEIEDQLRAVKVEDVRLAKALEEEQEKFRKWKKEHAAGQVALEEDPQIQTWMDEKQRLRVRIPGLAF